MKKDDTALERAFKEDPMPYMALMGVFAQMYEFTMHLVSKIAETNDIEVKTLVNEINDDNNDILHDALYCLNHHRKKEVIKNMEKQADNYANGEFKEARKFMALCSKTGNKHLANELLDVFEKNKHVMSADDIFDTIKEVANTIREEREINKIVDEDYKIINPDTDLKN